MTSLSKINVLNVSNLNFIPNSQTQLQLSQASNILNISNDEKQHEKQVTFDGKEDLNVKISQLLSKDDISWVLCVLNINGLKQLNDNGNHGIGDKAI